MSEFAITPEGTNRFLVTSQSDPEKRYLCDLAEARCTCVDWSVRRHDKEGQERLCKHLKAIGAVIGEQTILAIYEESKARLAKEGNQP